MYFYFDLLFNLQHFSIKKIKVNNKNKIILRKFKTINLNFIYNYDILKKTLIKITFKIGGDNYDKRGNRLCFERQLIS